MQYYFIAHKKGVGDRAKEVPGLFTGNITRIVIKKERKLEVYYVCRLTTKGVIGQQVEERFNFIFVTQRHID